MTTDAGDRVVDAGSEVALASPDTDASAVTSLSFDEALVELQRTVTALEEGGLPLEGTIDLYERGVALHERCATLLGEAELRIRRLADDPGGRPAIVDDGGSGEPVRARGAD